MPHHFGVLRVLRKWLTARATDAALAAAPRLAPRTLDQLCAGLGRLGLHAPVISRIIADNMRAAGVYSTEIHRAHFAQLAQHFTGALHALRAGACGGDLASIAGGRVELDSSVERLRAATEGGRGAILVGPHVCNYLVNLARLNAAVPLTVYLRYSRDERRRAAKERWYRASGVQWISEPAEATGVLGRLRPMAAALAAGRTLFITPDLPQKRGAGVPVALLGREIELPAGAALLALRTGAPLLMLTAELCTVAGADRSGRGSPVFCRQSRAVPGQRLVVHGPCADTTAGTGRGERRAAIQARLQWFADLFADFLIRQAPLWYLWGDKRWSAVFAGDPRYARTVGGAASVMARDSKAVIHRGDIDSPHSAEA